MRRNTLFAILVIALFLGGCSTLWNWGGGTRSGSSSSLVDIGR